MDRTATMKETTLWVVISFIALTVLVALMVLSQIANISIIIGTPAPNLAMTTYHAPKMAGILVFLVILFGIILISLIAGKKDKGYGDCQCDNPSESSFCPAIVLSAHIF